jgi:hypothetical protein
MLTLLISLAAVSLPPDGGVPAANERQIVVDDPETVARQWETERRILAPWRERMRDEARFEARCSPPPLRITAAEVPEPAQIPYADRLDAAAYREMYRAAYLDIASRGGNIVSTCCLRSTVPNRRARIAGHYAGVRDANEAKVAAALRAIDEQFAAGKLHGRFPDQAK